MIIAWLGRVLKISKNELGDSGCEQYLMIQVAYTGEQLLNEMSRDRFRNE